MMTTRSESPHSVSPIGDAPRIDAVILAGGRGSRLGGRDKASLLLAGERLIDRAAAAAKNVGAVRVVVVGPPHTVAAGSVVVREDPPYAGPLAAVAVGLAEVRAEWLLLLSCDLVHPDRAAMRLVEEFAGELSGPGDQTSGDGVLLRDSEGFRQWLAGIYSVKMLRSAARSLREELNGDLADLPLRRLFETAKLRAVTVDDSITQDIDSPEDLSRAVTGAYAEGTPPASRPVTEESTT